MHDALRQAPEILHEHHSQSNRNSPELANRQWLHALVGAHEPTKHLRVKPAVGMGDKRPGQPKDARITLEVTLCELRQFSVIAGRQVIMDLAQLFVDDVVIVDQPLGRRCDGALLTDCLGSCTIRFEQHSAVVEHARQQRTTLARSRRDALSHSEAFAVLLETLAAEEFGPNRFFEL